MSCTFNSAVIKILQQLDKKESSKNLSQMSCTFNSAVIKVFQELDKRE